MAFRYRGLLTYNIYLPIQLLEENVLDFLSSSRLHTTRLEYPLRVRVGEREKL